MKTIADSWNSIEDWLSTNAPTIIPLLPPGVPFFGKAEAMLGYLLPGKLKDFLSLRDGSGDIWLHDSGVFMSLDRIVETWEMLTDLWEARSNDAWALPRGPIKKNWYSRNWLPFVDDWGGDHLCIDLDPAEGGVYGQVIAWRHDGGPSHVIASSFQALLDDFSRRVLAGRYIVRLNRQDQPYLDEVANTAMESNGG